MADSPDDRGRQRPSRRPRRSRRTSRAASLTSPRRSTTRSSPSPTSRQRGRLVVGRACRASRARASRRRSPRSSPPRTPRTRRWSTACASCSVYVKGPGLGPRVGAARAGRDRLQDQPHPRRHPDSPQRLPAAQAAPRLIARGLTSMARYIGSSLPALPARRHEAVPQGGPLLHRQVRLRAARLLRPASTARRAAASCRTTASSCARSRRSSASTASPSASSAATTTRRSRMKGVTGENLLQLLERRLDNVVYRLGFASRPRRGAPAGAPRPLQGQRPARSNIPSFLVPRERRRSRCKEKSQKVTRILEAWARSSAAACRKWLELDKDDFKGKLIDACRRATT